MILLCMMIYSLYMYWEVYKQLDINDGPKVK